MRWQPADGRVLRPDACLGCARPAAWPCCSLCLPERAGMLGPWPLVAEPAVMAWALGDYADGLRAAIVAGKLRGQGAALAALGRRLGACLAAAGAGADLVTWVASRGSRGLPRDHARLIAESAAGVLGLPSAALLHPAGGRDLGSARKWPLAFAPARPPPLARRRLGGGRILLVDDVITTGRTLAAAATALLTVGAGRVEAAALAVSGRAVIPQNPPTGVASRDP